MNSHPTVGDLMNTAAVHLTRATTSLAVAPFDTLPQARAAIAAFHQILDALAKHSQVLLGTGRHEGLRASTTTDVRELASLHLSEDIRTYLDAQSRTAQPVGLDPTQPWSAAARCVRGATDLLLMHADNTTGTFQPRSTGAALFVDQDVRLAGLTRAATMTTAVLAGRDQLALCAGQAGVPWPAVRKVMTGLDDMHDAATALTLDAPPASRRLDSTGPVHPAVRTFDPLVELTDHMRALRQQAWELVASPSYEIAPLRRFAALGLAVHVRAAQFYAGTDLPAPGGDHQHVVDVLMHRAAAWRNLAATLYPVRSIDPRDSLGGKSINRAATLLAQCANVHAAPAPDGQVTARQQRTKQAVNGALSLMGDITAWNARTFSALARSNQLFLPASDLHRDDLSQDATAAAAKLAGGYVALPDGRAVQIADAYTALTQVRDGQRDPVHSHHLGRNPAGTPTALRNAVSAPRAF
ncbi:hypothetical protein SAMN05216410_3012 [Sanguibacter gelidistatuariae]|uniref:Uncharacterized protein n=1 Tax=Sanguibacter gelidistatuariae TaxID=1814289 RepID=A0A1G6T3V4_9MICO|nr:hypothetical protein [Sanguibacter gelidistatuariae]SDD23699.1 hypothetical protein SAMN05216410_3012 [Sanguibacter gelidistatuariae]